MSMSKVYPEVKESFGTLLMQKRIPEEDKFEWNSENRSRKLTHVAYQLESSVQEGAITVLIPVAEPEINTDQHYDEEVSLINPVCELSSADARDGKANFEIHATKIQLGGNK